MVFFPWPIPIFCTVLFISRHFHTSLTFKMPYRNSASLTCHVEVKNLGPKIVETFTLLEEKECAKM